ncbi:citrate transporter [Steroidobacter denitrificans]|uniref:Citrate transporter n=1 Tax=Steroidobacter denitrificans TaxID=465721 RepID=A0A127F669_STEDE|nr:SLC13 family permease [Steroidobacter denitrificans]AMN45923.1 citrate transporter [Steroidobacter denitrificans]
MSFDLIIVLLLLAAAVAMFALNRPRMDAVALLMMTALPFTGVITMNEALAGFSDPNIVLIAALFVVGEGLMRTGVTHRLGDWLVSRSARSETRLIVLMMIVVAGIGSVMSSTAVVAIFIPVVLRIARSTSTAPSRLMMPLSFAGLFSGMMTLIATPPNLVVNGELVRRGYEGFHLFSITPFGLPLLAIGIAYMLIARRWLTTPVSIERPGRPRPHLSEWIEEYGLAEREYRLRITSRSSLIGKTLQDLDLRGSSGMSIVAIERSGRFANRFIRPEASTQLQAGDVLFLDLFVPSTDIDEFRRRFGLEKLPLSGTYFSDRSQEIGMAEVMIPSGSPLIGKTIIEARIRSQYGLTVIGLRRGSEARGKSLLHDKLQLGDTLLLVGRWKQIRRLQMGGKEVILLDLPAEIDDAIPAPTRAPHALLSLAVVIVLMVTGAVPNVQAALIGCLMLGMFRCLDLDSAYRSIHWQSIVLIVGMLPFSLALQKTGGVDLAADALLGMAGDTHPRIVLAAIFIITAALGLFVSNTATAVLMAPVALAVAEAMQASPYPFAMIVGLAASCAFMTPVSSPVNTLVVGPGNYEFSDFVKVGVPFALIALVISVTLIPWLLPF